MPPKKSKKNPKRSPTYSSSPASDADIPPEDPFGQGPVYFFHDPATDWMSQWYLLDFAAPLPTRNSIMKEARTTEELGSMLANQPAWESISDQTGTTERSTTQSSQPTSEQWHIFDCNEQYMMYAKAALFSDHAIAEQVLGTKDNPRKCKGLGRKASNFDADLWDQHREHVVEEGNWWKFTNGAGKDGKRVRTLLLETGERELVEASPFDRIWGIGFRAKDAGRNKNRWGLNLLGKAIASVRARIRELQAVEEKSEKGE
jgi:ribA/ribD-fused uncharacterized protein